MLWSESWSGYADGKRAPVGGLADESLAKRLRIYKRQVAKRYRVIDPEQIERLLTQGPYHISTKLDGELWFLVKREGEVALCAYNGRVLRETPLAKEAERLLADAGDVILAGELVAEPRAAAAGRACTTWRPRSARTSSRRRSRSTPSISSRTTARTRSSSTTTRASPG